MLYDIFALAIGLAALVLAGDKLVQGAVALAERLRISPLVIGLTIVAFGTSAPELFISLEAAYNGQDGLALGNVVGSNVANVLLVLGVPALISPVACHEKGVGVSNITMAGITTMFMAMIASGTLARIEGVLLFAALCAFLAYQGIAARKGRLPAPDYADDVDTGGMSGRGIAIALAIGIVGLPFGAHFTIEGASGIAERFGVSDAVIGLTVVAIGTSLPELITTVMAAIRKTNEVAIGNVIGSNIFNLAAIMGITASFLPLDVPEQIVSFDMWVMAAATILLIALGTLHVTLGRLAGAAMVAAYAAYMVVLY